VGGRVLRRGRSTRCGCLVCVPPPNDTHHEVLPQSAGLRNWVGVVEPHPAVPAGGEEQAAVAAEAQSRDAVRGRRRELEAEVLGGSGHMLRGLGWRKEEAAVEEEEAGTEEVVTEDDEVEQEQAPTVWGAAGRRGGRFEWRWEADELLLTGRTGPHRMSRRVSGDRLVVCLVSHSNVTYSLRSFTRHSTHSK